MVDIARLEIKKILSKKDMMLILIVLILAPLLFSICIVNQVAGINFGGMVSIENYGIMIWSFLKYLFVLYLVPIYMAASFLGKEVENRSIHIMLANKKRSSVIYSKVIVYIFTLTVFFLLFQMMSVLSFEIFIKGTKYAMLSDTTLINTFFIYLFQWLELVFVLLVSVGLCCVIKGNAVLVMGLVVIILEKILVNIEGIKRVIPYNISDYSSYNLIDADKLLTTNLISIGIYGALFLLLFICIVRIWKTRDF